MPNIAKWLDDRLHDDNLIDLAPNRVVAPLGQRRAAIKILDELTKMEMKGLCHADSSPGNLVKESSGKFFLIDPRGMNGEVAYDIAVLAFKALPERSQW